MRSFETLASLIVGVTVLGVVGVSEARLGGETGARRAAMHDRQGLPALLDDAAGPPAWALELPPLDGFPLAVLPSAACVQPSVPSAAPTAALRPAPVATTALYLRLCVLLL